MRTANTLTILEPHATGEYPVDGAPTESDTDISPQGNVIEAYQPPFGTTFENSWWRLQRKANITGVPIACFPPIDRERVYFEDRPTVHIDLATPDTRHREPEPGVVLLDACKARNETVLTQLAEYKVRIGTGHSLGALVISLMQLAGEQTDEAPFDYLELVDGFNFSAPEGPIKGYWHFGSYTITDSVVQALKRKQEALKPETRPVIDPESSLALAGDFSVIRGMRNAHDMMRSDASAKYPMKLARTSTVGMHVVALTHGLSGSEKQARAYLGQIEVARRAADEGRSIPGASVTPRLQRGWHSDLVDSNKMAELFGITLGLAVQTPRAA